MRINIYAEEIHTREPELVTKVVTDDLFGTRRFYGVRFWIVSPPELHSDPADDDTSAVTFWVPWTNKDGNDPTLLHAQLLKMADLLLGIPTRPVRELLDDTGKGAQRGPS